MAGSGFALIPEVGKLMWSEHWLTIAILVASILCCYCMQVCIYFNHELFRGNRCTKISSTRFGAYNTPNILPLATLGMNVSG